MSVSKYEIRISKSETNPNDQNSNVLNQEYLSGSVSLWAVSNFEHLYFDIVSYFEFRVSNFKAAEPCLTIKLDINFKILGYEDI